MNKPKMILALVPHPDDAEFYAGGTIARMIAEGAQAVIVIATDGRRGSFQHDSETLINLRREEAKQAAAVLGAEPPILLGHADMGLDALPPGFLREQFVRLIRQYKPDVVITEDPFAPDEVHPDHRAVAWAASDAISYASLPLVHPEHLAEGLQPHFVLEKYFYAENPSGANKIVDVTDTMEKKLAALAEHKTQMTFLFEDVVRQARLAALNLEAMLGEAIQDPLAAISWALKAQAASIGQRTGVQFGEAFRYARFHPFIESLVEGR
ncbi:MAG: PIG-L family deacetylase [Anaerolineae bacterium CG_4_9_14_0_8_um_filter_58_9]|nr:MAG: PIG-L family deacetylase [Anaerolineae bacterium CG_4_9_14_0_8_um_filter_58_9]